MTRRGTVKNGVVVLESGPPLEDGTPVEVRPLTPGKSSLADDPAFGIWRDRDDLPADGAAASMELRRRTERRGNG